MIETKLKFFLITLSVLFSLFVISTCYSQDVLFRYPLEPGDYYQGRYFEHNMRDYNCGSATYSGHGGTDFYIGNYGDSLDHRWDLMDEGVDIVAAADGIIEYVYEDSTQDHCTSVCRGDGQFAGWGGGNGNFVVIKHADGYYTLYAHMKYNSVPVEEDDVVLCGDKIGEVGNSGTVNYTGPHLHFIVASGPQYWLQVDPYAGSCSPSESRWVNQGPFEPEDARVNFPSLTCQEASSTSTTSSSIVTTTTTIEDTIPPAPPTGLRIE